MDAPLDPDAAPGGSAPAPYRPFPPFADFADTAFDATAFEAFADLLKGMKAEVDETRLEAAVRTATKWAAVDTGAIEGLYKVDRGFTFSVAAEAAAWDNLHLAVGENAQHAINDALTAYDFVLDVATASRPLTEAWIRELHAVICASQETYTVITTAGPQEHELKKGKYKEFQNNPYNLQSATIHAYAPVEETAPEMARLVNEFRSEEFTAAHPVIQAAYAHYAFVCIHPFADGNGRVSRALASVFLYRSPGVPLVIFADQKPTYIDALEAADAGDFAPFLEFIADRAADVVRMVVRDLKRRPRVALETRLQEMQQALLGRGGLSHDEVDALSVGVGSEVTKAFQKAIEENPVHPPLSMGVNVMAMGHGPRYDDYRSPPKPYTIQINVNSAAPATASISRRFTVWIAKGTADVPDFIVVDPDTAEIIEEVLIRDMTPFVSPSLTYRLDISAEEVLLDMVDRAIAEADERLRQSGYKD